MIRKKFLELIELMVKANGTGHLELKKWIEDGRVTKEEAEYIKLHVSLRKSYLSASMLAKKVNATF